MARQTIRIKREFSAGNTQKNDKATEDFNRGVAVAGIAIVTIFALSILIAAIASIHH